jgi:hypothetical protein
MRQPSGEVVVDLAGLPGLGGRQRLEANVG